MTGALGNWPWAWLAAGLVVSFATSAGWRRFALRRRMLDLPDARRLHVQPTPRGGGIGIALVLLAVAPWLGPGAAGYAVGLCIVAGAGLLDDLRPLGAMPKLVLQCAGALPLALAWPLAPEALGVVGGVAAAWIVVLVLVNFWNFMDGSNGLAASQAGIVGLALALLCGPGSPAAWIGLALAAGSAGFLPHNLPRARLFLGDVGSHALGYGVAAGGLLALAGDMPPGWPVLLLLPSAVLLDAGLTLCLRLWRRRKVWLAHREHLYQRAVLHGWRHGGICLAYAIWTVAASVAALAIARQALPLQLAVASVVAVFGLVLYVRAVRQWPLPQTGAVTESMQ